MTIPLIPPNESERLPVVTDGCDGAIMHPVGDRHSSVGPQVVNAPVSDEQVTVAHR